MHPSPAILFVHWQVGKKWTIKRPPPPPPKKTSLLDKKKHLCESKWMICKFNNIRSLIRRVSYNKQKMWNQLLFFEIPKMWQKKYFSLFLSQLLRLIIMSLLLLYLSLSLSLARSRFCRDKLLQEAKNYNQSKAVTCNQRSD